MHSLTNTTIHLDGTITGSNTIFVQSNHKQKYSL
jgi:hypothetical protein